jgi:hypothetical protein
MSKWVMRAHFIHLRFKSFPMIEGILWSNGFWLMTFTTSFVVINVIVNPMFKHYVEYFVIHLKSKDGGLTWWWNGACFEKCWITTQNIHPLWKIKCYCSIWKKKDELSHISKIVWRWHGHSWTLWMKYISWDFA